MSGNSHPQRKAQLDKAEREHLEDVVAEMRERVEDNVRFQLTQANLDTRPGDDETLDEVTEQLVEAIELEAVDDTDWDEAFEEYVDGVGYTIVNRLAALRCMEVRDFIDEEVTVFKENGLTPAAETLVHEEFLLEDEAILAAYHNTCDELAAEIDILFDRSSAYSLIDPDDDTFEELCGMLDSVDDEVWRADDVLGWVYEYYNVKLLDDLRRKGDREGLDPEDVPPANQFYTPHWVVRMLTDNSLGKLYLEHTGELQAVVDAQASFDPNERKNRPLSPDKSPEIADFCTYLVPSEEAGEPTEFDHPRELRVIDPACGSGHFLLYAFDVLERIWRAETDVDYAAIPRQILRHNLYGVDLDMRACQLSAFNLYLKGRTRAEAEGADGFEMPEVGIVCADATVADIEGVEDVFQEVAAGKPEVEDALRRILDAFEEVHGLGSLLDVRGTLGDLFDDSIDNESVQITLSDDPTESYTLGQILRTLREAVDEHRDTGSFLAQDLRSFVQLLDVLAQDYDVALMNPPYGAKNRMPETVRKYVENHYKYSTEFYVNFFEVCDNLIKPEGRTGMLVPHSFMFKTRFQEFREDFVGQQGEFDFLCEFGYGVLDNAMVGTVGTVVRSRTKTSQDGTFIRLHDVESENKESTYLDTVFNKGDQEIKRFYRRKLSDFSKIPRTPLSYSIPEEVIELHASEKKLDANAARIDGSSIGVAANGMNTGDNDRFIYKHWEVDGDRDFVPYAKGGTDAWILPHVETMLQWGEDGSIVRRFSGSLLKNEQQFKKEGLTWTYIKRSGRRFGYFPAEGVFDGTGSMFFPNNISPWLAMAVFNSNLYHGLFLSLTIERHWQVGDVGRIPWSDDIDNHEKLENKAKEQYRIQMKNKLHDPTSRYYVGPVLLPKETVSNNWFYNHSNTQQANEIGLEINESDSSPSQSVDEVSIIHEKEKIGRKANLETKSQEIDEKIYNSLDISDRTRLDIQTEIFLRTNETPEDREIPDLNTVSEVPENFPEQVKDLVHHFAMVALREESDGIIPLSEIDDQQSMLDCIVDQFHDAYGEYAEDRLAEVDDILGTEAASEEAYPNLRAFIDDDLFAYHISRMENTPIIWRLSTDRLIADADGEGFGCFVDYHQVDGSLFDRLSNQYLEPRKADLREQRSAANRRRSDDSLSTTEKASAADAYEHYTSAIEQIDIFEDVVQDLAKMNPREFDDDDRERIAELVPKIAAFREETKKRLDTLESLYEMKSEQWFKDTFSNKFWETIEEWRDEWLDALSQLEHACTEYAKPSDEPVEAHLADLFDYFNWRLKGSDHYSSSGILFTTYYFEREGNDLLDEDGNPFDNLTEEERKLATLAMGLDDESILDQDLLIKMTDDDETIDNLPAIAEYKALAEEIDNRCQTIYKQLPSDWKDRALSEITTTGYDPNRKHGVEINITPLAEAEIVPKTVDDKVL